MCPVVWHFWAFLRVAGRRAARARRRPRPARRHFGQAAPWWRSRASRTPAAARRRGPTLRPGRAGFSLVLVLAPVPSTRLPRSFRAPCAGKLPGRPGNASSALPGRSGVGPPWVAGVLAPPGAWRPEKTPRSGPQQGTWCSGITPAQHAGGPGFTPQCVHEVFGQKFSFSREASAKEGLWAGFSISPP